MSLEITETADGRILEVHATGKLTKEAYDKFVPKTEEKICEHGKIRVMFVMHDFHGWTAGALWEDIKFDLNHFHHIERLAIVGEAKWEKACPSSVVLLRPRRSSTLTTPIWKRRGSGFRSEAGHRHALAGLHPDSPRPVAFGNCQAGYQTLMAAMLRPDLFGTVIMAGSPLSYWQGVHGKNPMRYEGGYVGGSWLTALTSDLGNGKVDGAYFIENFDNQNPTDFLWGKQYRVYANIDTEPRRYLGFEKWWGDFIQMNGTEVQYIVDELFVGDKLTRSRLISNDGQIFDARNVTSPVVCFASLGDNISPPPQALGWILDLYHDVEEIKARGRTIVYCLDPSAGHLAIFVSSKVAAKEDAAFVRTLDIIDVLPPGLYELIVTPKSPGEPCAELVTGDFLARFEPRTLDDVRLLGRNSEEDDRVFANVARISKLNLSLYRAFLQPFVRLITNESVAEMLRRLNPLRLSYTIFADDNPAMAPVAKLADYARNERRPVGSDNPLWLMQEAAGRQIEVVLDKWRNLRDRIGEAWFFAIYGSPMVQGLLGISADAGPVRRLPAITSAEEAAFATSLSQAQSKVGKGGIEEAIVRALLFVLEGERQFDERVAAAFRELHLRHSHLTREELKLIVRDQAAVLQLDPRRAIDSLAALVPDETDDRARLLKLVKEVVSVTGAANAPATARLDQIARTLALEKEVTELTPTLCASAAQPM